jgi:hypothetical protein
MLWTLLGVGAAYLLVRRASWGGKSEHSSPACGVQGPSGYRRSRGRRECCRAACSAWWVLRCGVVLRRGADASGSAAGTARDGGRQVGDGARRGASAQDRFAVGVSRPERCSQQRSHGCACVRACRWRMWLTCPCRNDHGKSAHGGSPFPCHWPRRESI